MDRKLLFLHAKSPVTPWALVLQFDLTTRLNSLSLARHGHGCRRVSCSPGAQLERLAIHYGLEFGALVLSME